MQRLVLRLFRTVPLLMLGLVAVAPSPAQALAIAQGVALNTAASCSTANLDLTLTTIGATREYYSATNLAGQMIGPTPSEQDTTLTTFGPGTYVGYVIGVSPPQPAGTLIGSYAWVGASPPSPATTAEFFVYYNCSTRQVLLSCFGPYGTCPQTALQAQAELGNPIPALHPWGLVLAMLLLGGSAYVALRRR